jgi:uncharacterized membrane protein YgcG
MILKTNSKKLVSALLCAILLFAAFAATVSAADIEKTDGIYVYDEADVISAEIENDINSRAKALCALTGSQIVTVTVKTTGSKSLNDYTAKLFSDWKLSAEKNNAVLVVLAIEDKNYFVLPGSALTEKLSTEVLYEIFAASLEPDFAAGKYAEGAKKLFDDLLSRVEKIYSVDISTYDPNSSAAQTVQSTEKSSGFSIGKFFKWFFIIVLIIAGIVIAVTAIAFFRRPRYVNSGSDKRRHYNTDRGAYVGVPEKDEIERARRREAMMRARAAQNGAQGQGRPVQGQNRAQYPNQGRPVQAQNRAQYPGQGRPVQGQNRAQYPGQGRPVQGQDRGQYPSNRAGVRNGQNMQRPPRREGVDHEHQTVYPDRAPYVDRSNAAQSPANRTNTDR